MKTSEVQGAALDWAVAKCEGYAHEIDRDECWLNHRGRPNTNLTDYCPSNNWELGGPIIERERISVWARDLNEWAAETFIPNHQGDEQEGPTSLVAAMRCYVASKLGDEIEIPEELK